MPIFIFGCDACDHEWEELMIRTTDAAPTACIKCGAECPKKRPTSAGHRFRASEGVGGWEMNHHGTLQRVVSGNNSTRYGEGSV